VLRYWETEFEALGAGKSKSGQRVYSEHELGVIRRIKELLYEEGYTIAGAKKRLQSELGDGRTFGSTEAEGELSEADAAAGDEPPAIPVEGEPETGEAAPEDERESVATIIQAATSPAPRDATPESGERSERTPRGRGARRRRGAAEPSQPAPEPVERVDSVVATEPAPVDSALSQRVETLEHGLRRVLDEVRHLRDLLADPSADR
jgi:DNA-binding transcriptional MerR regulator